MKNAGFYDKIYGSKLKYEVITMKRASGVLMHISSLYGGYSIGSFGKEAKEFVDFLVKGGFSYWQVLPFCMADEKNSPYKSYSAFGANPYFIDLPTLNKKGLLTDAELLSAEQNTPYLCEYERLGMERLDLLRLAAARLGDADIMKINEFLKKYPALEDASRFMALRTANDLKPWYEWTEDTASDDELLMWKFVQYEFFTQWAEIKAYANKNGVKIIGDIPIYISHDSADVWANKEQFLLDEDNFPTCVAGVPPDYFAKDGQLWGNPLYDWKKMKEDGYSWWGERIKYMLTLFDGVRIDHFRGLESFWSVPAAAETAKEGKWIKGPAEDFVDKLKEFAGEKLIIAEDLGDITKEVVDLLDYSGFPGMRVIQFAFLGDRASPHLPHNYCNNCVAYTGTHDNNTLLGHVWETDPKSRRELFDYCGYDGDDWSKSCFAIMKAMLASHAGLVIFPIQDIFVYGNDTRMNIPGTADGNWEYRITKDQLENIDIKRFKYCNTIYGR